MKHSGPLSFARLLFTALLIVMVCVAAPFAPAQTPGVTDNSILIGSCSALDGPAHFLGRQTVLGASAYLHMINDAGGVFDRKIQLQAFDDGYDPGKAPACFKRMTREGVFALGFFVGTPTALVYVPMAQEDKIPVVGLFTGAQLLYEPLKHEIINVRASYYDETREQVDRLWQANVHKIGVIYQDDAFGKAVLDGVKLALQKHSSTPAAVGTFTRNTVDVQAGLGQVRAARPQAVIIAAPYAPAAAIVKQAHANGWRPQFVTVSFVGTEEFVKEAGSDAEGTIITQVIPPYNRLEYSTVEKYRECLAKYAPGEAPTFVSFEGFVDAMVFVEGLKRAGKDLTREKFISAIESIHDMNVGLGPRLILNYGPNNHKGFKDVYATIIKDGQPALLTDWSNIGN